MAKEDKFLLSDRTDADILFSWREKRPMSKKYQGYKRWLVDGIVPTSVYAIHRLMPMYDINIENWVPTFPGADGMYYSAVKLSKNHVTYFGASSYEDAWISQCFALRNGTRHLIGDVELQNHWRFPNGQ